MTQHPDEDPGPERLPGDHVPDLPTKGGRGPGRPTHRRRPKDEVHHPPNLGTPGRLETPDLAATRAVKRWRKVGKRVNVQRLTGPSLQHRPGGITAAADATVRTIRGSAPAVTD